MSSVTPIDQALLPADIRDGSPELRARYSAALGFERELVGELAKQLTTSTSDALGSSPYASLLPDALADSIAAAGGLGLARQLAGPDEDAA